MGTDTYGMLHADRYRVKKILFVGIIFILGASLRLYQADSMALSMDETVTWEIASKNSFNDMWRCALKESTPPLLYSLVHLSIRLFGDSPKSMRYPSVLFGILLLPVVFWIMGLAAFRWEDQALAMLLCSFSSVLIYYSHEARNYSILLFFGVLSFGLLIRCFKKSNPLALLAYSASIVLLLYSHYYGFLLVAAQLFSLMVYKRWNVFCAALAATGATLLAVWATASSTHLEIMTRESNLGALVAVINMCAAGAIKIQSLTGPQPGPYVAYSKEIINLALAVTGFLSCLVIFCCNYAQLKHLTSFQKKFFSVLCLCIVIPVVLALLAGSPLSPSQQWLLRGIVYICPFYFMCVIIFCRNAVYKKYFVLVILIINCMGLYAYYTSYDRFREKPFEFLNSQATTDDLLVVNPYGQYPVIKYYYHGSAKVVGYHMKKGWIDLEKIMRSNDFYLYALDDSLLMRRPEPKGNIYVYHSHGGYIDLSFFNNDIYFSGYYSSVWKKAPKDHRFLKKRIPAK